MQIVAPGDGLFAYRFLVLVPRILAPGVKRQRLWNVAIRVAATLPIPSFQRVCGFGLRFCSKWGVLFQFRSLAAFGPLSRCRNTPLRVINLGTRFHQYRAAPSNAPFRAAEIALRRGGFPAPPALSFVQAVLVLAIRRFGAGRLVMGQWRGGVRFRASRVSSLLDCRDSSRCWASSIICKWHMRCLRGPSVGWVPQCCGRSAVGAPLCPSSDLQRVSLPVCWVFHSFWALFHHPAPGVT